MLSDKICNLYKELPISVLIFEEKKLIHINRHLCEMFCIDELLTKIEEIKVELYCNIFEHAYNMNITTDVQLHDKLVEKNELFYKAQNIQIDTHFKDQYTIFVLTLIKSEDIPEPPIKISSSTMELKILNLFSKTDHQQFRLFSMYKGLHIQSDAELIEVSNEELILKVSKRHLSSFNDNNKYIISPNERSKKIILASASKISSSKQYLYLSSLQVKDISAKDRSAIRVKCMDDEIDIVFNDEQIYKIYDLSLYSICVEAKRLDNYFYNKQDEVFTLKFTLKHHRKHFNIIIQAKVAKIMKYKNNKKVVLKFLPNEHAIIEIKNYINFRQMQILRELKHIVDTI
ncbi:MAG TPA: hypothetical protein EYO73_09955 [Sulfurimonas sp.]|nr:hypothetical protein [Sulfurimonas sp.]